MDGSTDPKGVQDEICVGNQGVPIKLGLLVMVSCTDVITHHRSIVYSLRLIMMKSNSYSDSLIKDSSFSQQFNMISWEQITTISN